MKFTREEAYEEIAATYQCLEIARLNEVLKRHGVSDKNTRTQICEEFVFESGGFLDSGWFEGHGKKVRPQLCFVEGVKSTTEEAEDHLLYMPSESFAFHEYANGDIHWYFDEHAENASEIKTGEL